MERWFLGNHALIEDELLAGVVVVAKERHVSHFVNLVGLVHAFLCLNDQVQAAPEGNEVVTFPETKIAQDKIVAGPL